MKLRGEMGSRKSVVFLAIACGAMVADVRPVEAPETDFHLAGYARPHVIIPVPIMGIRGALEILKVPPRT